MGEYRVMNLNGAYQIQQKTRKGWDTVGEFDNITSAKMMVRELRGGNNVERENQID